MNSHTWEHAPLATAVVSPKSSGALVLLPGIVWRCWRSMFWSHISGSTRRSGCIKPQAYVLPVLMYGSEVWTITKALAHGLDAFDTWSLWKKSFGSRILNMLPMLLSRRLPAALQFPVSWKQDVCASLATWYVQIPGKIIKLSVRRSDHQETGGDLEGATGACIPPGWGGLMPMYSRLTSVVSTQLGGRLNGQLSCSLAMYHRHSKTPLGALRWRRRMYWTTVTCDYYRLLSCYLILYIQIWPWICCRIGHQLWAHLSEGNSKIFKSIIPMISVLHITYLSRCT